MVVPVEYTDWAVSVIAHACTTTAAAARRRVITAKRVAVQFQDGFGSFGNARPSMKIWRYVALTSLSSTSSRDVCTALVMCGSPYGRGGLSGRQRACGSSLLLSAVRCLTSAAAHC